MFVCLCVIPARVYQHIPSLPTTVIIKVIYSQAFVIIRNGILDSCIKVEIFFLIFSLRFAAVSTNKLVLCTVCVYRTKGAVYILSVKELCMLIDLRPSDKTHFAFALLFLSCLMNCCVYRE